jgi:drug/metabolite transporter (DMT)-like permease
MYPGSMTRRDFFLYATAVFCWGTSWIALRMQSVSAAPEPSVFWRFVLATALMFGWALIAKAPLRFDTAAHKRFLIAGLGIFSTNFILFYHGGRVMTSGLLPVLFSLATVGNLMMGAIFLGQRMTLKLVLGALIGICGVTLMFSAEFAKTTVNQGLLIGVMLCLLGTVSFCVGNTASALSSKAGVAFIPATAWGMLYGTVWVGLVTLVRGESFAVPLTPIFIGSMAWLVIVATIIAFWAFLNLVQSIGSARASYTTVMFPVVGLLVSTFAETLVPGQTSNYQWTLLSIIGIALAIGGNVLVLRR